MASSNGSLLEKLGDGRKLRNRNGPAECAKTKQADALKCDSPRPNSECVTLSSDEYDQFQAQTVIQQSSSSQGQALPATIAGTMSYPSTATGSGFSEITNGFLLTSACSMYQAKTMASKLAVNKVSNVQWRYILNNATSQRSKQCGGPTCGPIRDLLTYHSISQLKIDSTPLCEPSMVQMPETNFSNDEHQVNSAVVVASGSAKTHEVTEFLRDCPDTWSCAIIDMPNSFSKGDQHGFKVAAAANTGVFWLSLICYYVARIRFFFVRIIGKFM